MSRDTNRQLVESYKTTYAAAATPVKKEILNTIVAATGYDRKHVIKLLQKPSVLASRVALRHRKPRYNEAFCTALTAIWEQLGFICAKRLVPFLPTFVPRLEQVGFLKIDPEVREKLMTVSAATVDRLLRNERKKIGRGISMTKRGNVLRQEIGIRTFADWDENQRPGFFEIDLVAHNGGNTTGPFVNTLSLTDIHSGWIECCAIMGKSQTAVVDSLEMVRKALPLNMEGLDSDNGGEFINFVLDSYCETNNITFTRGRPFEKNDQAHIEEKNGSVVRRFVGYQRHDSMPELRLLNRLYKAMRLFVNYFQPSMKLLRKERDGAKIRKYYLPAATPCQRLLEANIDDSKKAALKKTFESLNPIQLLDEIKACQEKLRQAHRKPEVEHFKDPPPQQLTYSKTDNKNQKRPRKKYKRKIQGDLLTQIHAWLNDDPRLNATAIIKLINSKHPGSFQLNQRLTVNRVVGRWRDEHPEFLDKYDPRYQIGAKRK